MAAALGATSRRRLLVALGQLSPAVRRSASGSAKPAAPLAIERADPGAAEGLLLASHALMDELFPSEDNHYLGLEALRAPSVRFFVARDGTAEAAVLGCGAVALMEGYGEVKSMFTEPAARGRGVGLALLSELERQARSEGLRWLRLETGHALREAMRLYARFGFTECGPFGDYEANSSSVFMEKALLSSAERSSGVGSSGGGAVPVGCAGTAPGAGASPVILDCDTGADDAIAILMAAASPRCNLLGVTTCQGNTPVRNVTENTLRTLEAGGFGDVAVVQGAAVALDGKYLDPRSGERVVAPPPAEAGLSKADAGSYEQSKLLDCLPPASGARHGGEDDAARWLVETILANPGVALVPTGPMTNIAQALRLEPAIVHAVSEIVFMGGTVSDEHQHGVEFNILVDPLAAREVLEAGWRKVTMVGLDVTSEALLSEAEVSGLTAVGTAAASAAHTVLDDLDGSSWSATTRATGALEIYDACAMAAWLRPELLTSTPCHVEVDEVGRTLCDLERVGPGPINVHVGVGIDRDGFVAALEDSLAGRP